MPLAIVFAGLVSAATDSVLLPGPPTDTDLNLISVTAAVGIAFGILAGLSRPPPSAPPTDNVVAAPADGRWLEARSWASVAIGFGGFGAMLLVGVIRTVDVAPGAVAVVEMVASASLLAGSWLVALPRTDAHIRGAPQFWGAAGAVLGMAGAVYVEPLAAPRAYGAIAVVFVGAVAALLALHLAGTVGDRRALRSGPKRLRRARALLPDRVPVLTIVIVWVFAGALLAHDTVHQARTIDVKAVQQAGAKDKVVPGPLKAEVYSWLDRAWKSADTSKPRRTYIPMLFVAASGGGAKAAYWTDLVLDCMFGRELPSGERGRATVDPAERECEPAPKGPQRYHSLFLTSSVSGGSVGVQHFVRNGIPATGEEGPWVDEIAGREVLSPIAAWGLFHDLPVSMLGGKTDPRSCLSVLSCRWHADRSLVQEAAVARFPDGIVPPPGEGLLNAHAPAGASDGKLRTPLMIFNGALDGADGRALMSRVRLSPPRLSDPGCPTPWTKEPAAGSIDGHDLLNAQKLLPRRQDATTEHPLRYKRVEPLKDIPLVTAALLSARFPFVAPAGRLGDGPDDIDHCTIDGQTLPAHWIRDGGYMENSGVLTIVELLPEIQRLVSAWKDVRRRSADVQFVVVSIDDDPTVTGDDIVRLRHSNSPLGIRKQVGKSYVTRLARDRLESCQYRDVYYRRVSPNPHAGATAATGWEVSETVRTQDLGRALRHNRDEIETLREILEGTKPPRECAS